MERVFFATAFTCYGVATSLYVGYALTRRETLAEAGRWTLGIAAFAHGVSLIIRTVVARQMPGHSWYVPWSNWFESFSFLALVMVTQFLLIQRRRGVPILGAFVTPLVFLSMVAAINSPSGMQIPVYVPALRSIWMAIHVPVMFIAYAAFANAFAVGLAFLLQERQLKTKHLTAVAFRLPSLDELDTMIYRVIWWAFPLLTLGLLLGARWAYDAWGRYWGWDAKETWALLTWMIYLSYLIMRLVVGWRGRKAAYLSMAGFGAVLFTYVGVNYLSDLHGFLHAGGQ